MLIWHVFVQAAVARARSEQMVLFRRVSVEFGLSLYRDKDDTGFTVTSSRVFNGLFEELSAEFKLKSSQKDNFHRLLESIVKKPIYSKNTVSEDHTEFKQIYNYK